MKLIFIAGAFLAVMNCHAQDSTASRPDTSIIFTKVEIEAAYPGGTQAWLRFLGKNFRYPEDAVNNEIQGVVVVQFKVDMEGNTSDIHAISGPEKGGLREEAERIIKISGKWTPAVQNGRMVRSYKRQPMVFRLAKG
jgi:periplasmic protein TonB